MPTAHEAFWNHSSFAFVGHSAKKPFPRLSYGQLKKQGRKVFAVDPSVDQIDGDATVAELADLPEKVEAVVIETPREETAQWVAKAADLVIRHVWIHL
jgi:predicted CoA-binding protein